MLKSVSYCNNKAAAYIGQEISEIPKNRANSTMTIIHCSPPPCTKTHQDLPCCHSLAKSVATGDESAVLMLLDRFHDFTLEVCESELIYLEVPNQTVSAEDVVQTIWLQILERKAGMYQPEACFGAWLRVMIKRQCLNWAGSRARELRNVLKEKVDLDQSLEANDQRLIEQFLLDCIASLSDEHKVVIEDYLARMPKEFTAKELKVSVSTVFRRWKEALDALRSCIELKLSTRISGETP